MYVNYHYCGNYFVIKTSIKSLSWTPEAVLCVHYMSIKLEKINNICQEDE